MQKSFKILLLLSTFTLLALGAKLRTQGYVGSYYEPTTPDQVVQIIKPEQKPSTEQILDFAFRGFNILEPFEEGLLKITDYRLFNYVSVVEQQPNNTVDPSNMKMTPYHPCLSEIVVNIAQPNEIIDQQRLKRIEGTNNFGIKENVNVTPNPAEAPTTASPLAQDLADDDAQFFAELRCITDATVLPYNVSHLPLSTEFIEALKITNQNGDWMTFIKQFGTHYFRKMKRGSVAQLEFTIPAGKYRNYSRINENAESEVEALLLSYFEGGSTTVNSFFKDNMENVRFNVQGSNYSSSENLYVWKDNTMSSGAIPLDADVAPIVELLDHVAVMQIWTEPQRNTMKSTLSQFIKKQYDEMTANILAARRTTLKEPQPKATYGFSPVYGVAYGYKLEDTPQYGLEIRPESILLCYNSDGELAGVTLTVTDGKQSRDLNSHGLCSGSYSSSETYTVPPAASITSVELHTRENEERTREVITGIVFFTDIGVNSRFYGVTGSSVRSVDIHGVLAGFRTHRGDKWLFGLAFGTIGKAYDNSTNSIPYAISPPYLYRTTRRESSSSYDSSSSSAAYDYGETSSFAAGVSATAELFADEPQTAFYDEPKPGFKPQLIRMYIEPFGVPIDRISSGIRGMNFQLTNGQEVVNTTWHGYIDNTKPNNTVTYQIPEGRRIVKVLCCNNQTVTVGALQFVLDDGQKSQKFGASELTKCRTYDIPGELTGVFGRYDTDIQRIYYFGFLYNEVVDFSDEL